MTACRVVSVLPLATSVVEGVAFSTVIVHATRHLGIASAAVGVVLAIAGVAALGAAVPLYAVADRIGLHAAATVSGIGSATALPGYAVAHSLWAMATACKGVAALASRAGRRQSRGPLIHFHRSYFTTNRPESLW